MSAIQLDTPVVLDAELVTAPPGDDELYVYCDTGPGFSRFAALSKLVLGLALGGLASSGGWLLVIAPFAALMVVGAVLSLVWSFDLRPFDLYQHERLRRRWTTTAVSSVDVFITCCGEDPAVIRQTIKCALGLVHGGPVDIHVLDDGASFEVEHTASMLGVHYIRRPNRGWMKKAGNIDHALTVTTGEFIVVLDADFAARPDFLSHTLPYFADEKLGILQTPQYFRTDPNNWVEAGAAEQQEAFYRVAQRSRDRYGGAICVGTNAVYRRETLERAGGVARIQHSEDIFTGLKVLEVGSTIKYLPIVLAAGSCPSTPQSLGRQQYRWALGTFALVGTPLFKRARLNPRQRLGIWDGWLFYVTSALSPLVAVATPLLCLAQAPGTIRLWPSLLLVPTLVTEFVVAPRWYLSHAPRAGARAGLVSQMAHLFALIDHVSDREQEWIPTGGTSSSRQRTDRIPEIVAVASLLAFAGVLVFTGARVAQGWPPLQFVPLVLLAAFGLRVSVSVFLAPLGQVNATSATAAPVGRELTLDVIRTVSLARVIVWHALGYWWISWVFGAMPAVFYVSGAVLAKSLKKQSVGRVVARRLRRLLPTYLAFVAIAFALVALASPSGFVGDPAAAISWIVPYRSPDQLSWEGGWLSTPLWFLRALVVVLLLCPLLLTRLCRARPGVSLVTWGAVLAIFDVLIAQQSSELATAVWRGVADVVCYGGFFVIGVRFHENRDRTSTMQRWLVAGVTAMIGLGLAVVWTPPEMVVNNSYLLSGFMGIAWLMAFLALEKPIANLATIDGVARIVQWFTGASMTVYLWHTVAICIAYWIIGTPTGFSDTLGLLGVASLVIWFVVRATRPIEQRINGASVELHTKSVVVIALCLVLLAGQPTLFPTLTEAAGPPAPSGRPPVGAERTDLGAARIGTAGGPVATQWLDDRGIDFVGVAIDSSGVQHDLTHGEWSHEELEKPFEVMSITKTMVATVALRYVEEGRLTLDGTLPEVDTLPDEVLEKLTLRRLLSHATGLVDYRDAPGFREDRPLTRADAVAAAASASDLTSLDVEYAATNYIAVGLLLEGVADEPLDRILHDELFEPLGLSSTRLVNNDRDGFVGQGSAGVVSTLSDLARWYDALYQRGEVLSPKMLDAMLYGGREFSSDAGLGAWRHCPCRPPTADDPTPWFYAYHDGGDVRLLYLPEDQVTIAVRVSEPLYGPTHVVDGIDAIVQTYLDQIT